MITLSAHQVIADYERWKLAFDEHQGVRCRYGGVNHRIYQDLDDPRRLAVYCDFPSEAAARAFLDEPSLKEAIERSGAEGGARFRFAIA